MLTTVWFQEESLEGKQSRFRDWYDRYEEYEGEPLSITVHQTWDQYGGPEEGGWWFRCGSPVETICIFSREQAVRELIDLHEKYNSEAYEEEEYDISLARSYAEFYPKHRPHYE
jgi:hypothetical protein